MKRFVNLCMLVLASIGAYAQIDTADRNWRHIVDSDFSDACWTDWYNWIVTGNGTRYKTYIAEWPSGVTRGPESHMVCQRENIAFNDSCGISIVSEYVGGDNLVSLECGDYDIPPRKYHCDTTHHSLYYTSGNLETENPSFTFGYYELRCRLPMHPGAKSSFWLYGNSSTTYEEIDIFENGKYDCLERPRREYTCGIWYNAYGQNYSGASNYAKDTVSAHPMSEDFDSWHTYSCEWMPERITWYLDGVKVNEFTETDKIPKHGKVIKVSYSIGASAYSDTCNIWKDNGTLSIGRLDYYRLSCDCEDDVNVVRQCELDSFDYSVKRSVAIVPDSEVVVEETDKVTFRVTDDFLIDGPFQVDTGGELTIIIQECPE